MWAAMTSGYLRRASHIRGKSTSLQKRQEKENAAKAEGQFPKRDSTDARRTLSGGEIYG